MSQLKGVCIGAGYFSKFQYEAWNRIPEVSIAAMCNRNASRGGLRSILKHADNFVFVDVGDLGDIAVLQLLQNELFTNL